MNAVSGFLKYSDLAMLQESLRGSHPRQIVARLVDLAAYRGQPPRLTPQSIKEAFDACFNPALGNVVEADWAKPSAG